MLIKKIHFYNIKLIHCLSVYSTRFGGGMSMPTPALNEMPEMVVLDVELVKDSQGLGITIAGYTCERVRKLKS